MILAMRIACAVLVVAGCQTDHPDYPINPGGGTTGVGSGVKDAGTDALPQSTPVFAVVPTQAPAQPSASVVLFTR